MRLMGRLRSMHGVDWCQDREDVSFDVTYRQLSVLNTKSPQCPSFHDIMEFAGFSPISIQYMVKLL